MEAEIRKKIDKILGPKYCLEDYSCSKPGLKQYGNDGQTTYLVCLKPDPSGCSLAEPRVGKHECRCVLRTTLLEKLH